MSLRPVRTIVRELVALSRNYRHAAVLRRHLRRRYGAAMKPSPGALVGEIALAMNNAPWGRLTILAILFIAARKL